MSSQIALYIITAVCICAGLSKAYSTDPIDCTLLCVIALAAGLSATGGHNPLFLWAIAAFCAKRTISHIITLYRVHCGYDRRKRGSARI